MLGWSHGIVLLAVRARPGVIVRIFTKFSKGGQLDNPKRMARAAYTSIVKQAQLDNAIAALRSGSLTYTEWATAQRIVDVARHECALQGRTSEARELIAVLVASQKMLR